MGEVTDPFGVKPSEIKKTSLPHVPTAGRYRLPNRDGSRHTGGWTRATNLASAISDTKALGDWEVRMTLLGVREVLHGHALYHQDVLPQLVRDLLNLDVDSMKPGEVRSVLSDLAGEFKKIAKAELGSTRGNLAHQMVEHWHSGLPPAGAVPEETLAKLPAYITQLQVHKLEPLPGMQERQVMVESLNGVGTLDNIMRDMTRDYEMREEGMRTDFITDLKTQKRFWSWLEIAAQLAFYAHGDAMWDKATLSWVDMPPVNQERALVAWMPWEHPAGEIDATQLHRVDMYEVDIVKGWETMLQAHKVFDLRAAAKRKGESWGWLRPIPRASLIEEYARRLRDISTPDEGSAVYAEATAAGVWGPELQEIADESLARLQLTAH
jgi:hypothetical protein